MHFLNAIRHVCGEFMFSIEFFRCHFNGEAAFRFIFWLIVVFVSVPKVKTNLFSFE